MNEGGVTGKYLKRKFPDNPAIREVIDYIDAMRARSAAEVIIQIIYEQFINNTTNIFQTINHVIGSNQESAHDSYLIENTTNVSETVTSIWSVLPYEQQCGVFEATVTVHDKTTNAIMSARSLLSFDYSEAPEVTAQNDLITAVGVVLTVGVDLLGMLYVAASAMSANPKRIHVCLKRCVLSTRAVLLSPEFNVELAMSTSLTSIEDIDDVDNTLELSMSAVMSAYIHIESSMSLSFQMAAIVKDAQSKTYQYGLGYNGYALLDSRGLAPAGYHLPTGEELQTIINTLGGEYIAGGKLKQTGIIRWLDPNVATNESGFNAVGTGNRDYYSGEYVDFKAITYIGSTTIDYGIYPKAIVISNASDYGTVSLGELNSVYMLRLIKNDSVNEGQVTDFDGNIYPTIKIGDIVITAVNIYTRHFNNGDIIPFQGAYPNMFTNNEWKTRTSAACCPPNGDWALVEPIEN